MNSKVKCGSVSKNGEKTTEGLSRLLSFARDDLSMSKLHFQLKPEELNQSLRSIFNEIAFAIHISEEFETK